ncbi:hypothetical protein RchiOBHm_Chr4g0441621 [Rosa chinensis]|uniref:Uncharacterized protein n=1 Tax=Rosa chinensis TaxID=74649 RepID=A0A2P6R3E0_ROSCH|nr:hypothetical protein RchiOBHm_Chr4g0441621 [Rosa chinensis]
MEKQWLQFDREKEHKKKRKIGDKEQKKKGKKKSERRPHRVWKKKSIFFELPYWKVLLVRHNLDVMHIEKNICDSILGTLLNLKGKSKDGLMSRKDLEAMQIRQDLHPKVYFSYVY